MYVQVRRTSYADDVERLTHAAVNTETSCQFTQYFAKHTQWKKKNE